MIKAKASTVICSDKISSSGVLKVWVSFLSVFAPAEELTYGKGDNSLNQSCQVAQCDSP